MRFLKSTLPTVLAFVMGVLAVATYFIPHQVSRSFQQETTTWFKVIGGVTIFIGVYSLLRVHYGKIKRRQKGFGYSVILFFFFSLTVFFGILNYGVRTVESVAATTDPNGKPLKDAGGRALVDARGGALFVRASDVGQGKDLKALTDQGGKPLKNAAGKPLFIRPDTGEVTDVPPTGCLGPFLPRTTLDDGVRWLFTSVSSPAGATTYSLLGFFICSAAYRTFRAKTVEAAVLLVAALIVMLGQVPIATMIWREIPVLSGWLLDVPNMAVKRAVLFGICVGSVSTSLRVMFGIERSYMGGDK